MIRENAHRYPILAQCKALGISRCSYYYEVKASTDETELEEAVQTAYEENRSLYGSRKIKSVLRRKGLTVSRRKICKIMKQRGLVSAYTQKKYKVRSKEHNESTTPNLLDRKFNDQAPMAAVVSDLTYVRVGDKWGYVCILVDLHNREIIGYSAGDKRDAALVRSAFATVKTNLYQIQMFHTDRGREFDNRLIDEMLTTFEIKRSLSLKGNPYDNAVVESTFKMIKTEFVNRRFFESPEQLALELYDYVHWYNNIRLHGSLGNQSPVEYRMQRSE